MPRFRLSLAVVVVFSLASLLALRSTTLPRASAASFTVNSTTDAVDANPGDGVCATGGGQCTLRAAIQETNAVAGADTITLPAGTYTLSIPGTDDASAAGDLDITDHLSLTSVGPGTTIIDGGNIATYGVFESWGAISVNISNLTIRNGSSVPGGGIYNHSGTMTLTNDSISGNVAVYGGGINNGGGTLTITSSTISGNNAGGSDLNGPTGRGGGIYNGGGAVTVTSSTITGNTTNRDGGGIYNASGTVAISNNTVAGNHAGQNGGGILVDSNASGTLTNTTVSGNTSNGGGGGVSNFGTLTLTDSTVSGNTAVSGGGITNGKTLTLVNVTVTGNSAPAGGGGIQNAPAALSATLKNTILASNTPGGNCSGTITSSGHNLDDGNGCGFAGPGDLTNTNPQLGPLADNGGPAMTHALLPGSPAIDAGDNTGCPATDQRGYGRPMDGDGNGSAVCDIGAFEAGAVAPTPSPTPSPTPAPASLTAPATVGATEIQVDSTAGFAAGDHIVINPGGSNGEANQITGFGSLLLATPLQFSHQAGESVVKVTPISVIWGDVDCSTSLSIGDAQKTARSLIGLSVTQTPPCPHVGDHIVAGSVWGDVVWGDVDCNEAVTIGDAQKTARKLIGLPVTQAEGCPEIGSSVELPALVG
jgi:CSLREA domain-containing protein